MIHQSRKELQLGGAATLGHALRQRMLDFTRSYIYYCTVEVPAPAEGASAFSSRA